MTSIDLRSDTVTVPTQKMRHAMVESQVGDDVYQEDPTVIELEERSADLFGKEAGLFFPTGTMANQAAIMAHTTPGDEIIIEENMHIYMYEVGGLALLSGLQPRRIAGNKGILSPEDVENAIRPENIHFPQTTLACLENSHNVNGGTVLTKQQIDQIAEVVHSHGIPLHLDGARVFNAASYLQQSVDTLTSSCDSVMFCLSKGLAAPVGSVIVGERDLIDRARKCRKLLGGGMRQAGVLASAGLVALETMTDRLQYDHENAKLLAAQLAELPWIDIDLETVQTNIIRFNFDTDYISDEDLQFKLMENNIKVNFGGSGSVRMVTHKDVDQQQIEQVICVINSI